MNPQMPCGLRERLPQRAIHAGCSYAKSKYIPTRQGDVSPISCRFASHTLVFALTSCRMWHELSSQNCQTHYWNYYARHEGMLQIFRTRPNRYC